jgi:predicted transcriptional regulator of viral defense system
MDIKHKNITILSSKLLSKLNAKRKVWFKIKEIYELFPELSEKSVSQQLTAMVNNGLLMRIREGLYYIIPYERDSETFMPDWHLLAEPLSGNDYYIGYYSALQIHQLVTQPSLKEQIVVNKQIKPSETTIRDVKFQFVYHGEKYFFGYKKLWIDNYNKAYCSDLEKTIIDCLSKPCYAGGIVEIAKAMFMAKEKINFDVLLEYAFRFNSQAVIKRLGYLLELLQISTPIAEALQNRRTASVSLLDTEAPKNGKILTRWNIQQNVDIETIKSAILT